MCPSAPERANKLTTKKVCVRTWVCWDMSRASLQSTVDQPAAVLAPESGGDSAIEGTEQQNVTQDSLEDAASPLLLGITPLAGPNNGGTSLTVSLGAQQQQRPKQRQGRERAQPGLKWACNGYT